MHDLSLQLGYVCLECLWKKKKFVYNSQDKSKTKDCTCHMILNSQAQDVQAIDNSMLPIVEFIGGRHVYGVETNFHTILRELNQCCFQEFIWCGLLEQTQPPNKLMYSPLSSSFSFSFSCYPLVFFSFVQVLEVRSTTFSYPSPTMCLTTTPLTTTLFSNYLWFGTYVPLWCTWVARVDAPFVILRQILASSNHVPLDLYLWCPRMAYADFQIHIQATLYTVYDVIFLSTLVGDPLFWIVQVFLVSLVPS